MPNRSGVRLTFADAQYKDLGQLDYAAGQPGERLFQIAAPGTYYVHLYGWANDAERFSLLLTTNARAISSAPPGGAAVQSGCTLNDTFQCAEQFSEGGRVDGAIGGNGQHLYYRFVLDRPGVVEFALNPMPNRSGVRLTTTDAQYQALGQLDYAAGQPRTQLLRISAPGTYYVHMYGWANEAERFSLTVRRQR